MKILNKFSYLVLVFVASVFLLSCGSDEEIEKTEQELFTINISDTWSAKTVVVDNIAIEGFDNFTLTVGDGTYSTTNGNGLWPASGSWSFSNSGITSITRDDAIVMSVNLIDDNNLEISFTYDLSGGRVAGVNDNFVFSLTAL